ncbi:ABC transporter substrate-binding protein [Nocardia sp. CDC159]|uniref:ABC transporter substrate-binding protein n=1 Tax=Nocardia pulmonis TaxID=2951408 RepID=A0A9X2EEB7_9NOCA|nr:MULTISPECIES: ABC transporter substrate-binding protein [Nocardia]MCM6776581.1 ABC transporter substrate-binding protein [Nocardia pulmonis]MCM6789005.1 ABC transporter substrate-binding protein [Nocardia sp. CDC159]
MRFTRFGALVAAAVVATGLTVAGCTSGDGGSGDIVTVNAGEPQNPLVPTNTNENMGGRVLDRLFAGLKYYDADGKAYNEVAQAIETTDRQHYKITLKDWKFIDGTPVTAKSFVDAWNYGALGTNGQNLNWAYSSIAGFDQVSSNPPTAQTLSGLKVIDDKTFTVDLKQPSIDFELSLGFAAFYPMPDVAFKDMKAFGENPIGNGPYKFANSGAWQHNVQIDLVPNPDYPGGRKPKNKGLRFVMYQSFDTAYADLLAGNLDALDTIPTSALSSFKQDLGDRAIGKPTAQNQHVGIQPSTPHFGGEEGVLRRRAISMAINRQQICDTIWKGTKIPARDFTAATLPGFRGDLPGVEFLQYNPEEAKKLWAQANALSPWSGRFEIAYNSDGGHQDWIEAVANSIKNTLGIDAVATPYPTFKQIRDLVSSRTIGKAFRYGWQGDYPSMFQFLTSQYLSSSETNDVDYKNPEFDRLIAQAQAAPTPEESYKVVAQAQTLLLRDMADIPVLDYMAEAGHSEKVKKAPLTWNGLFDFENIEK